MELATRRTSNRKERGVKRGEDTELGIATSRQIADQIFTKVDWCTVLNGL